MNFELIKEQNEKHASNPQPGDYWQEFFSPCFLVLEATSFSVSFLHKKKKVGQDMYWDVSQIETCTPTQFKKRVSYGSIPGTWCDVEPNWKYAAEYIAKAKAFVDNE